MGLSNFPTVAEGVLPVLVMNTVLSVALLKNLLRSVLQLMGAVADSSDLEEDSVSDGFSAENARISVTQFKSLGGGACLTDCCVCLCGFEAEEEVSELSCKHFFHRGCLDKWFHKRHTTCPLCRSIR